MDTPHELPSNVKLITVPLAHYLETLWRYEEAREERKSVAEIIYLKDPDSELAKVEFPDEYNKLLAPRVWRIGPWRSSLENRLRLQRSQEETCRKWAIRKEQIDLVTAGMINLLGVDPAFARDRAVSIVDSRKVKEAAIYGVKLRVDEY